VIGLRRRAKYGLIDTDRGDTLVFHLGMSGTGGSTRRDRQARPFLLETDDGRRSRSTMRGGSARSTSCRPTSSTIGRRSRRLGPSRSTSTRGPAAGGSRAAGGDQASAARPADRCRPRQHLRLRSALPRRHPPERAGGSVSLERLKRWSGDPRRARRSDRGRRLDAQGFRQPDGELGYFSKAFAVYDREGRAVRCGGTVRRIVQGGRSTFYCPRCQHVDLRGLAGRGAPLRCEP
jgi:formamidopyrimidine-DNA glycosylase